MSTGIGSSGHIGIRVEESFASGGDVTAYQSIISEDISMSKNYLYVDRIMGTSEQVGAPISNVGAAGSITFPVTPENSEIWWQCGIGGTVSPFKPARPLKSMVVEIDRDTGDILTSGDMISSLAFSSSSGATLQCVASMECKGFQTTTAGSPSYTSGDNPYMHSELSLEIDDTAVTTVTDLSFTVENNLITDLYATGKERRDIPATKCNVTGSMTLIFESTTQRNKFLAESDVKIQATYTHGTKSIAFLFPTVKYNTDSQPLAGQNEYIAETIEFTSYIEYPATDYSISVTTDLT